TPETELFLFEASRSQLVREIIKPALARGMCVIADRFFDSTTVYQGAARKLDRRIVDRLNAFAVGDCVPDITFVLDVDAATAESRMRQPRAPDRMEQQPAEFYERVREGYRQLAAHDANAILKTYEQPPKGPLLLLLSALPEALPETILSRCIGIPLEPNGRRETQDEQEKLVKILQQVSGEKNWTIQCAYRLAQEFQRLLRAIREEVKGETDKASNKEITRYKDATDGAWLDEREQYYKALAESFYLQRRAGMIETVFAWWTDVLRARNGVAQRDLPHAKEATFALATRFSTAEI